jgi:hypothetical protein
MSSSVNTRSGPKLPADIPSLIRPAGRLKPQKCCQHKSTSHGWWTVVFKRKSLTGSWQERNMGPLCLASLSLGSDGTQCEASPDRNAILDPSFMMTQTKCRFLSVLSTQSFANRSKSRGLSNRVGPHPCHSGLSPGSRTPKCVVLLDYRYYDDASNMTCRLADTYLDIHVP